MTTPDPAADAAADPVADLVAALTAVARLSRPVLERDETATSEAGQPAFRDTGLQQPEDVADLVAHALASAAANVGGIERLLAGRPGSWEADLIRQLVAGTVGWDAEHLAEYRTEPLRFDIDIEGLLFEAGLEDAYNAARLEIDSRWRQQPADPDGNIEQSSATEALEALEAALEQQWQADMAAYEQALVQTLKRLATERGYRVPVILEPSAGASSWASLWITVEEELLADAVADTALPGDGRPPLERLQPTETDRA